VNDRNWVGTCRYRSVRIKANRNPYLFRSVHPSSRNWAASSKRLSSGHSGSVVPLLKAAVPSRRCERPLWGGKRTDIF
jgi:hypothetical protein